MTATDRVVLIAYDGSRQAKRAVSIVSTFIHEERVILLTAWQAVQMQATRASSMGGLVQPDWDSEKMVEDPGLTDARNFAFEGEKLARENGITHTESYLVEYTTSVWNAITKAADELDADLIVAGTHGRTGFQELMHPSVADRVLKHGHRPVLIVPPEA